MNKTTTLSQEAQAAIAQARFDALLAISAFAMTSLALESRAAGTKVNKKTAIKGAQHDGANVMYDLARVAATDNPAKMRVLGSKYWRRARIAAKAAADLNKDGE